MAAIGFKRGHEYMGLESGKNVIKLEVKFLWKHKKRETNGPRMCRMALVASPCSASN